MQEFVHLHLHSEYSLLDGACRVKDIPRKAKELGQRACAITDHGALFGAVAFYKACKEEGIKPIIGCEVYVAPRSRKDKDGRRDISGNHLVLLCKNAEGYKNLCRIVSDAYTEGFYSKPRTDLEMLKKYNEGLIALSACLAGYIPTQITAGNFEEAERYALLMRDIYGPDGFYLEIQDHRIEEQAAVNSAIADISAKTGIPLVCTNDVHYLERKDAYTQAILTCIQTGNVISDGRPLGFETDEFYFKSGDEMQRLFSGYPGALQNTVKIADACNFDFEFGDLKLPTFDTKGTKPSVLLRHYAENGLKKREAASHIDYSKHTKEEYLERIDHELSIIESMGFCEYFLIVRDFVTWAKVNGIPVGPGRGSGAGSLVSYLIGITDVDPLVYSLLFERFLNPERVTMPDFDIDICQIRREEVIRYVTDKYGADHVSQIIAFDTLAARGAIRDVGRALGLPYSDCDTVAKAVPRGYNATIADAMETAEFSKLYRSSPQIKQLIDIASALEGMPRHASTHAAGVVITDKPLTDYIPVAKNGDTTVTQYEMTTVEALGLVKIDFLGLRFVTIMDAAEKLIKKEYPDFDLASVPFNDKKTYKLISAGHTAGIFQLESAGMRQTLMRLQPDSIDDVIASIALYRPGPMESIPRYIDCRHHPEKVRYTVPELKDIIGVTHGCIVYQEQVMQIFRALAGYTYGQADIVRRAMAKKKLDVMEAEGERFVCEAVKRGIEADKARSIYSEMANFAKYAFNKSHAAAYAVISYRTAYLKAHYTRFYMAALLSSVLGDFTSTAAYIAECGKYGIKVLAPDINESDVTFGVFGDNIRFGLLAVKGIGAQFARDIVRERSRKPFASFADFISRMSEYGVNKKQLEMLIKCGAFDGLGVYRSRLMATYEMQLDMQNEKMRRNLSGQLDLFSSTDGMDVGGFEYPELDEFSMKDMLIMEKESAGMYFSGHMLDDYSDDAGSVPHTDLSEIVSSGDDSDGDSFDGKKITVIGSVRKITKKNTKNGDVMAFVTLEDRFAEIEILLFPKVFAKYCDEILLDNAVAVSGTLSAREDESPKLLVQELRALQRNGSVAPQKLATTSAAPIERSEPSRAMGGAFGSAAIMQAMRMARAQSQQSPAPKEKPAEPQAGKIDKLCLKVPSMSSIEAKKAENLIGIFCGNCRVLFYDSSTKRYVALSNYGADVCRDLIVELKSLLGDDNVVVVYQPV
ncbi:MAG: DNA polymerase III subunit alpha [Clostridia bacterium]|nr:DNA polymerase III subunit alpha [Clostridia bacterium]